MTLLNDLYLRLHSNEHLSLIIVASDVKDEAAFYHKLDHVNIVKLYGVTLDAPEYGEDTSSTIV